MFIAKVSPMSIRYAVNQWRQTSRTRCRNLNFGFDRTDDDVSEDMVTVVITPISFSSVSFVSGTV